MNSSPPNDLRRASHSPIPSRGFYIPFAVACLVVGGAAVLTSPLLYKPLEPLQSVVTGALLSLAGISIGSLFFDLGKRTRREHPPSLAEVAQALALAAALVSLTVILYGQLCRSRSLPEEEALRNSIPSLGAPLDRIAAEEKVDHCYGSALRSARTCGACKQ